jgi:hypothetical protein
MDAETARQVLADLSSTGTATSVEGGICLLAGLPSRPWTPR